MEQQDPCISDVAETTATGVPDCPAAVHTLARRIVNPLRYQSLDNDAVTLSPDGVLELLVADETPPTPWLPVPPRTVCLPQAIRRAIGAPGRGNTR